MAHSPAKSGLDVGSVIADTYTIEAMIGRGGMGSVFVASHARLPGKKVAIKILHPDVADPESLARFRREAEIASRLGHPNIVDVLDWNNLPDGTPYLVLEFLQGEPLSARVAHGPMPLEQVFAIVRQVGSALAAAHAQDIVHRDLKPQNVFLVPSEADGYMTERAKVLDFGISKIRGSTTVKTQDTSILGTPQYMAPEQATGNHAAVDARTDVFALGAMVYEMLSGAGAFAGASIPEVVFKVVYEEPARLEERVPGVPAHVAAAVHKAMSKKQDERFPTVAAFVEALTGSPLVTARRGIALAPNDGATPSMRTKQAAGTAPDADAFAKTMGSGDHAQSLGVAQTMATDSARRTAEAAGAGASTVPVAANPAATTTPTLSRPGGRSHAGVIIAVALIVAAAAVAVAVIVMQGKKSESGGAVGSGSGSSGGTGSAAAVVVIDAGAVAVAEPDAAAVAVAAPDAAPAVAVQHPKQPIDAGVAAGSGSGSGEAEDDGSGKFKDLIAEAEAALRDGDPDAAVRLANKITNQAPQNPAAWSIKARAACSNQDREKALAALRHLDGRPGIKRRVVRACKSLGLEL